MGRKKKFIDKKKSATFQILARDSSDPNYDAGPDGDRVFVRVDNNPYSIDAFDDHSGAGVSGDYAEDPDLIFADAPGDEDDDGDVAFGEPKRSGPPAGERSALPDHVRREILELGFPDDGYNYLLHLREIRNTGGGSAFYQNSKAKLDQLPLDVKAYDASRVRIAGAENDPIQRSMYSIAAKTVGVRVQKAADPEVAALLDEGDLSRFDSDVEELEEDFVICANVAEESEDVDKKLTSVAETSVVKRSGFQEFHDIGVQSITANEVRDHRPAGDHDEKPRAQSILDEQFELFERNEFGTDSDNDSGGAFEERYEALTHQLKDVLKDHTMDDLEADGKYKALADVFHENEKSKNVELLNSASDVIQRCIEYAKKYENEDADENVVLVLESSDESDAWDCETIISTYSNLDNHPGKIEAPEIARKNKLAETVSTALSATSPLIALRGKEKLPVDFLPNSRRIAKKKEKADGSSKTQQQNRKQHGQESKEEKKERKAAVKEERREARRVKKDMKSMYKSEAQRAQKVAAVSCPASICLM